MVLTVIFARQDIRLSGFLMDDRKCSVSTDVQKGVDVSLSVLDDKEGISCYLITSILPWSVEL